MKDYLKANLERLGELRLEVDAAEAKLRTAQELYESVRNRYTSLRRFLDAEIAVEQEEDALVEFRRITARDPREEHQTVPMSRRVSTRNLSFTTRHTNQETPGLDFPEAAAQAAEAPGSFNKTRFLVELWAHETQTGRGVNARQLWDAAQRTEHANEISLPYVHNTLSRFRQSGRAEQNESGSYLLTEEGMKYLQGGD